MPARVGPVRRDATSVCLLTEADREQWLNAPMELALELQKPLPAGAHKIVARDTKEDGALPDH